MYKSLFNPYFKIFKSGFVYFGHGVVDNDQTAFFPNLHLKLNEFEVIIDYWLNLGFTFISFDELNEIILNGAKPEKSWIHLTFDDGYKNNMTVIYPYLKKRNIPFTIFVSTKHIIENNRFDNYKIACAFKRTSKIVEKKQLIEKHKLDDNINAVIRYYKYLSFDDKRNFLEETEKLLTIDEWANFNALYSSEDLLSIEEIQHLAASGLVKIASHGVNHNILSTLTADQLNFEFIESKKTIEQITGANPIAFCYPNGSSSDFNSLSMELCKKSGYRYAFSTINRKYSVKDNKYAIPRIALSNNSLDKKMIRIAFGL